MLHQAVQIHIPASNGVTTFAKFLIGSSGSFPVSTAASGNWNSSSTWSGGIVPTTSTENVIISSGHAVTYDLANTTINSISLNNTSSLALNAGNILTIATNVSNAGTITLGSNSSLRIGGNFNNSSTFAPAAGANSTLLSIAGNLTNTAGVISGESLYFSTTTLGLNTIAQASTATTARSISTISF